MWAVENAIANLDFIKGSKCVHQHFTIGFLSGMPSVEIPLHINLTVLMLLVKLKGF
jgi:hypothetical protein